ncbi:bifunctional UDP-N-acetylglucosamine diphosphorylase/glucosamine-1-phosphate N-acetyltransferase GlmU [Candidatus Paracaedibacter symbiosus]|uniref:bifunctional UDP-N-acetylglucosamine diphosphorylase/glucosamine-1-phosphate N-acetyltransferase GlmU n=1 Tax=Candidatus Paracaedibacter symbiosus TaxID=244582 RepID=UPI000689241A|nr:bifunctional UDP-N-acetylglucosamine diphosphorylase/glucosamine-1-phosphate N-acetyltransferase GlmU [Candidatus Paracaedibacter symbiosus]
MLSVIVLAAGQGTRMVSNTPKILHPVAGKPIVHHVLDVALALTEEVVVVVSPQLDALAVTGGRPAKVARQHHPRGTGDAVRAGLEQLQCDDGNVLILCGDVPLVQEAELQALFQQHQQHHKDSISVLGMRLTDPGHYGRIVAEGKRLISIVEFKEATPEIRAINLCNTGIILTSLATLKKLLPELSCQNAAQEYYLTDIMALGQSHGIESYVVEAANSTLFHGINNRAQLAQAEQQYQQMLRHKMMLSGVTLLDPDTVYFAHDTVVGRDTTIYPNVFFGEGVAVGENVTIYPNCHLVKTLLGNDTKVGPFAHLRDHTILEDKAEVGNFVEVKKSRLGTGAKAKHLTYLGDAVVGTKANIGAGVITCNYDGVAKHQTTIGAGAFIGSNSALVAPISIGDEALIGAGSVITKDVPGQALGIAREKQKIILNWVKSRFYK